VRKGLTRRDCDRLHNGARAPRSDNACMRTGLSDRRHLRAIHIKPWCECDDGEQLDGFNGLLLSPHLAHLFARGYISFSDSGTLLVSEELNPSVLQNRASPRSGTWTPSRPSNAGFLIFTAVKCFSITAAGGAANRW
jgi:putative restriction endonuclease